MLDYGGFNYSLHNTYILHANMNFNSILLGLITNNGNIPQMMIDPSTGGQMTIDGSGI